MSKIELDYKSRKTAIENIAAALNEDGTFTATTWCKPTTKSGYPAINGYLSRPAVDAETGEATTEQFMVFSVNVNGYVNIKKLADGTDQEQVEAALEAIKVAAGLEYPPRISEDYTEIVPLSVLNKKSKDGDSVPNTVNPDLFKARKRIAKA